MCVSPHVPCSTIFLCFCVGIVGVSIASVAVLLLGFLLGFFAFRSYHGYRSKGAALELSRDDHGASTPRTPSEIEL